MASDKPSYSEVDEGFRPQPNKAIVSFAAGKSEICSRIFTVGFAIITLILLSVALGFNNSSAAADLPSNIVDCSINISTLDPAFLRRSVNIFGGIWVAVTSIAIIYQIIVIILRFLNFGFINNNFRIFITVDLVISHILQYMFIGGIVGGYLLGYLWGAYTNAVDDQITGNVERSGAAITGLIYGAYGGSIGLTINNLNHIVNMSVFAAKNRNCKITEYNNSMKNVAS